MKRRQHCTRQAGFLMIEVLITLLVLMIGLLGLVGLQSRATNAETDSYQRIQALILLRDLADRINANRTLASSYVTGTSAPLGTGLGKDCSAPVTTADRDLCAWQVALLGAVESSGGACDVTTGANCVGAMIDARGCVTSPAAGVYLLQVVWQGLTSTAAPPSSVDCGSGLYGAETLGLRRAVTTVVQIGSLSP
jgi:type IV pilus assembly protein PilV